jgi:hypothetical protein
MVNATGMVMAMETYRWFTTPGCLVVVMIILGNCNGNGIYGI